VTTVAIVGAGPAGLRAAERLVRAGLRPVLIDEAPRVGGQIYRQPPPALQRPPAALYGFEAGKARALFDGFAALQAQLDHRSDTLVWQIENRTLHLLRAGQPDTLPFDALILATGATDRVLPFPGWTLPGVFTLGAAQVALKSQATLVGPRVVFAGTGPLLYLVAWQYTQAGGAVQAVLDTAPAGSRRRALPKLLARPSVAAKGAYLPGPPEAGRRAGAHWVCACCRPTATTRVQQLHWQVGTQQHITACDAIAFGHGLRSETQLADLAGCAFDFDALDQAWLPRLRRRRPQQRARCLPGRRRRRHPRRRCGRSGRRPRRAGAAGRPGARCATPASRSAAPGRHQRFREGLEALCPLPADWAASGTGRAGRLPLRRRSPPATCAPACATPARRS
jgi:hydrogen cyanide synthase HcnB